MKGVSPVVSFMFTVAVVLTLTMTAYLWAVGQVQGMGEPQRARLLVNQMVSLDYAIREAAHGDTNFTTTLDMYYPNAFLRVDQDRNLVAMTFIQGTQTIGYVNATPTACCYGCDFIRDAGTNITLARETPTQTYRGSLGGTAEIAVCYPDIDIVFSGACSSSRSGPQAKAYIKKIGLNASGRPIIGMEIC